ncbi:MAG: replication-relaxation family protein [Thermomicrobiales bacterium]
MTKHVSDPSGKAFRVQPGHERLLIALARYERLTAEQTRRLLFGAGSLTYVQTKYKELADAGYVLRVPVGRPAPHGSGPLVYSLDRRGRAHLASLGQDVPRRLRQSEDRARSSPHLRHSIAVVDVLILCELLCRRDPRLTIARMRGERELTTWMVNVTMPDGRAQGVATDGWADLRIAHPDGGIEQMCCAFEVDCGTEWGAAWRKKARALLAYDRGPYSAAFGVDSLTIVVVAPTDVRRDQLLHWTEQELVAQRAADRADLFRFGTMPDDPADAAAFFLAPRWQIPGQDVPTSLIEGTAE